MALTETTSFGATGYTAAHSFCGTTTYNVDSTLRCREGPGTGYAQIGGEYHNPGTWWDLAEKYNGWCRVPNRNSWSSGDFMSNPNPGTPTPGQFRISSFKVTATRETAGSKNLTIKYEWNWNNAAGTAESYYHWRVYCYAHKAGGGECQQNIYGDNQSIGANGSGSKSETYTIQETSGNTTLSPGSYGVWYTSYGGYQNPGGGQGNNFTFNIPKYVASPVRQYNGSSWDVISIKSGDGTDLAVKQYNGSSWVDL